MRVSAVLLVVSTAAWCSAAPMQQPPLVPTLPGINITATVTVDLRDTSSIEVPAAANLELRTDIPDEVLDEQYARGLEPRAELAQLIRRDESEPPAATQTPIGLDQQQPPRRSLTERDDLALP
jgi:hypothetical protein